MLHESFSNDRLTSKCINSFQNQAHRNLLNYNNMITRFFNNHNEVKANPKYLQETQRENSH